MDRWIRLLRRAVFLLAAAASLAISIGNAEAGVLAASTWLRKPTQISVSVVDDQNRPVPYATLWFIYAHPDEPGSVDAMERLVNRYRRDYDIAAVGRATPISAVLTRQADAKGVFRTAIGDNEYQGMSALPVVVGALKRGFEPTAYSEEISAGAARDIVLTLRRSPDQSFDQRMLELDEIRSEVNNEWPTWTAKDRAAHIDRLNARLQELAKAFEQEGKRSEAALAYYNLAYLPSIDRIVMPDGKERVVGYTRGYDEKSPRRRAYLRQAFALGQDIPQLRCRALVDEFEAQGGRLWADESKLPLRRELVANLESCLKAGEGRVLPWLHRFLSQAYSYIGDPEMACKTMQGAYSFEPASFTTKEWRGLFEAVERVAKRPVPGVPAFPNFVCRMPSQS